MSKRGGATVVAALSSTRPDPLEGAIMTTRSMLVRSRSMRSRSGFTLIELLIVVVIIGILDAIGIPKFANTKEKAIVASLKSDLRNLVTAQESFYSDNQDYAGGTYKGDGTVYTQINGAAGAGRLAFTPSANNTVTITYVDAAGWKATSSNPAVTST